MRIRGWHIDGFGVFLDHRIEGIADGITVFLGPNEVGKSTLLAFLRGVLFGYPSSRSREPQYPPLRGGRHGGKIEIDVGDQGLVTVGRHAERRVPVEITLADGTAVAEAELARLLGGADRGLFQQVFAFSLSDLQQLETLETEGVRDRIFSAGIAGAGRSAGDVIRRLDQEMRGLYLPRGRRTRTAELLGQLQEPTSKLHEARDKAEEYSGLCQHEDDRLREVRELAGKQDDLSRTVQRCKTLEELWPTWNELRSAQETLLQLETVDSFPADPDRRLAEAKGNCRATEDRLDELRAARQTKSDRCVEVRDQLDESLAAVSPEVEEHHTELRLHREHLMNLPAARQAVGRSERAMQEALRGLGPDWDRSQVEAFDTSLPRSERVRQWKERLTAALTASSQAAASVVAVERQVASAVKECERIRANLKPWGADESLLRQRESAVEQVDSLQSRLQVLQAQAAGQVALIQERDRALGCQAVAGGGKPTVILLALGAIMTAGAALWRIAIGDTFGFATLLCLAALVGVAAWLLSGNRPKIAELVGPAEPLEKAKEDYEKTRELIRDIELELSRAAQTLGLGDSPAAEQMAQARRAVKESRRTADEWRGVQDRLRDAEERVREFQDDLEDLRKLSVAAEEAQVEVERNWQQWKADSGVPVELTPDGVLAFLPQVEAVRDRIRAWEDAQATLSQLEGQIASWQKRACGLLSRASRSAPETGGEGPVIDAFLALRRACSEDAERRQEVSRLEEEMGQADTAIGTAEHNVEQARRGLEALLAEAGVQDEPAFLARLEVFRQREQMHRDIANWDRTLSDRLGLGPEAEALRTELPTGRVDKWQQDQLEAERELAQARTDHEEAVRRHQDAMNSRKAVEESADIPALELQIEAARCKLTRVLDEWRVKAIAKAIVQATLRQFVCDRQPTVLAEAGSMFQQVTGGHYERIELDLDGQSLRIVDRNLGRKNPEQLSRGTAEQLYLCLRLALAQEFGRQRCSLPVVMDDVLVNFDPARARAMAEALADFAQSNQILLFTCHPETAQILQDVCHRVVIQEIEAANG